jgi:mRNA-degrading endonuclease toxin of MazEF toxin-antitoxin module
MRRRNAMLRSGGGCRGDACVALRSADHQGAQRRVTARRGGPARASQPCSRGANLSSTHCDAFVSLPKPLLTDYLASLRPPQLRALDQALRVALALA